MVQGEMGGRMSPPRDRSMRSLLGGSQGLSLLSPDGARLCGDACFGNGTESRGDPGQVSAQEAVAAAARPGQEMIIFVLDGY